MSMQGYFGECGLRGGYMEVHGIGAEVSSARGACVTVSEYHTF